MKVNRFLVKKKCVGDGQMANATSVGYCVI